LTCALTDNVDNAIIIKNNSISVLIIFNIKGYFLMINYLNLYNIPQSQIRLHIQLQNLLLL